MKIHSYVKLGKEFENNFGKIRRVRYDPGKRPVGQGPLKRNIVEGLLEIEIAPVELNGLNEATTSKELERMQSGNTNLRDILSTPEQLNSEK